MTEFSSNNEQPLYIELSATPEELDDLRTTASMIYDAALSDESFGTWRVAVPSSGSTDTSVIFARVISEMPVVREAFGISCNREPSLIDVSHTVVECLRTGTFVETQTCTLADEHVIAAATINASLQSFSGSVISREPILPVSVTDWQNDLELLKQDIGKPVPSPPPSRFSALFHRLIKD